MISKISFCGELKRTSKISRYIEDKKGTTQKDKPVAIEQETERSKLNGQTYEEFRLWAIKNDPFKHVSLKTQPYETKKGVSRIRLDGTDKWELARYTAVPTIPTSNYARVLTKVNEIMPESTTGGTIAKAEIPHNQYLSQFYLINKTPKGHRITILDGKNQPVNVENNAKFKQNIAELANMPQEAYDNLVNTILKLSGSDCGFDSEEDDSIFISEDGKKLLVKGPKYNANDDTPFSNTLCTLLGGEYTIKYFKEKGTKDQENRPTDNQLRNNINTIAAKYIAALGNAGCCLSKTDRLNNLLDTGILDEITNSKKPHFRFADLTHIAKN